MRRAVSSVVFLALLLQSCTDGAPALEGAGGAGEEPRSGEPGRVSPLAATECDAPAVAMGAVQGRGIVSPWVGAGVTVSGVVVARSAGLAGEGVFLQSLSDDGDPLTSEGLFVAGPQLTGANVGQWLRITGTVNEQNQMTTLQTERIVDCGQLGAPEPFELSWPSERAQRDIAGSELEPFEGMWVRWEEPLFVTELWDWARWGEVTLTLHGRLFEPGDESVERRLILDDGRPTQNAKPLRFLLHPTPDAPERPPRLGDSVEELTGVLTQWAETYRLETAVEPAWQGDNPRPAAPSRAGSEIRVAGFNLANYFVSLGQRGAQSASELERQRSKLVATLVGLNADIVALCELQNNAQALEDLTLALNAELGAPVYAAAPLPVALGTDAIRVGFLYKPSAVELVAGQGFTDTNAVHRRPPQAQLFSQNGLQFVVLVSHAKSRSCEGARGLERDSGEGCFADERRRQSEALVAFLGEVGAQTGSERALLLGDFNAYPTEASLAPLLQAGLVDQLVARVAAAQRYSFVYRGRAGLLDHAFTTPALGAAVHGAHIWHINADEAPALSYSADNPAELYSADPFRSSDHDPIVVDLMLEGSD